MQQKLFEPLEPQEFYNSYDDWYTPSFICEAARLVMGSINLDPASCPIANEKVKASKYFTIEDDGLNQLWEGNVFINPPYSKVADWVGKMFAEFEAQRISNAIFICWTSMERPHVQRLLKWTNCFFNKRVYFWHPNKKCDRPNLATMATLVSRDDNVVRRFVEEFSKLGMIKL